MNHNFTGNKMLNFDNQKKKKKIFNDGTDLFIKI